MAIVNMDLAELKALEQQITDLKAEKQELIDKQMMVVIHHKYFNAEIEFSDELKEMLKSISPWDYRHSDGVINLSSAIATGQAKINSTELRSTKDYYNLSEIQRDIRNEIKEEYISEISSLKADIRALNDRIERAKDYEEARLKKLESQQKSELNLLSEVHEKDLDRISDINKAKLDEISQAYKTKLKTINHSLVVAKDNFDVLSKEFDAFKEDRKTKTLMEQIEELKSQLALEQNKTFWQKLFNKTTK